MGDVTARVRRRIENDFPVAGSASEVIRLVSESSDSERIQAAIVLWARGDLGRLMDIRDLAAKDWRDALVRGGLEHDDWPDRLDAELGRS